MSLREYQPTGNGSMAKYNAGPAGRVPFRPVPGSAWGVGLHALGAKPQRVGVPKRVRADARRAGIFSIRIPSFPPRARSLHGAQGGAARLRQAEGVRDGEVAVRKTPRKAHSMQQACGATPPLSRPIVNRLGPCAVKYTRSAGSHRSRGLNAGLVPACPFNTQIGALSSEALTLELSRHSAKPQPESHRRPGNEQHLSIP